MYIVLNVCMQTFASIAQDSIIASRETVGELTSFFVVNYHWGLLSVHPHALIDSSHFFFKNMTYLKAFFLSFFLIMTCLLSVWALMLLLIVSILLELPFPNVHLVQHYMGMHLWVNCHVLPFILHSCRLVCNCQWNSFSLLCGKCSKVVVMRGHIFLVY